MAEKLLTLHQVSVQLGGISVLDSIDFTLHPGEQWALTGPSGSGKTVLAHTLMGRHFHSGEVISGSLKIAIVEQQHRFKNLVATEDLYYQQRFNASDADRTPTVRQELQEYGFTDVSANAGWLDLLHVRPLLSKPLIQLSNGENKRVQLAIALSGNPGLLILDNPFLGLDVEGREILRGIMGTIGSKGISLLLITSPHEIPEAITHVAVLEKGRLMTYKKEDFPLPPAPREEEKLDAGLLEGLRLLTQPGSAGDDFSIAVGMSQVTVRYGDAVILDHIDWEVRKGEKWNLSGPNGAGKSTILSLITADNPQAYANEIILFDRRRGSGESIWDIKKKIGFVSPELHLYFDYSATCFEVIASGLFDTIGLFRTLSSGQEDNVLLWMQLLQIQELRSRRLSLLSTGQQRMVLLARALIKNPPLLILDEPCQGLDDEQIRHFRSLIDQLCEAFDTTLIYVSHYQPEIPSCVDHFLRLKEGKRQL
ncbi:MAG: ATP-binding cassette domain-containing protein [Puia sp.]|nr:ATP-binding cassette domain-containing protein [Puia sp.]